MLEYGYFPVCKEPPLPFEAPNNKSCQGYSPNIIKIINDWLGKEFIERCSRQDLTVCNPLTFVQKMTEHGVKDRLCLDLSRAVNDLLIMQGVHLDTIQVLMEALQPDEFLCSFDLSEMYCSLNMHPEFKCYLGFKFLVAGEWQYFRYRVLPFGLASAVFVTAQLTAPIAAFVHQLSIESFTYIDDTGVKQICAILSFIMTIFTASIYCLTGWRLNFRKSSFQPRKSLCFLGFRLD